MKMYRCFPMLALCTLAACNDDPVAFSAPVTLNLKLGPNDVVAGVVHGEKNINSESGNPYGAFVSDAKAQLAGQRPSAIAVTGATVTLAPSSQVATLDNIFANDLAIAFVINDSNNEYLAATGEPAAGATISVLTEQFDSGTMPEFDYLKLVDGSFKTIVRGPAASDFVANGADGDLALTIQFAAFK